MLLQEELVVVACAVFGSSITGYLINLYERYSNKKREEELDRTMEQQLAPIALVTPKQRNKSYPPSSFHVVPLVDDTVIMRPRTHRVLTPPRNNRVSLVTIPGVGGVIKEELSFDDDTPTNPFIKIKS
jgi:hypothetical protein